RQHRRDGPLAAGISREGLNDRRRSTGIGGAYRASLHPRNSLALECDASPRSRRAGIGIATTRRGRGACGRATSWGVRVGTAVLARRCPEGGGGVRGGFCLLPRGV